MKSNTLSTIVVAIIFMILMAILTLIFTYSYKENEYGDKPTNGYGWFYEIKNTPMDDENIEEEATSVILTDEDGNEAEFDFLDNIEYEGDHYLVMLPVAEGEDDSVVIMKIEEGETEEDDSLLTVTDEIILDSVYEIFKERNKDFFDFED